MDTNLREKFEQILTQQQMAHNVDSDWLNKLPDLKEFVLDCMSAAKSEGAETIEAETELIQYYEAKLLGKSESLQGVVEVMVKAAQRGRDFGALTADTVNYSTIEEMINSEFPTLIKNLK